MTDTKKIMYEINLHLQNLSWWRKFLNWIGDQCFARRCLCCDLPSNTPVALCEVCCMQLPWLRDCCSRCGASFLPEVVASVDNSQPIAENIKGKNIEGKNIEGKNIEVKNIEVKNIKIQNQNIIAELHKTKHVDLSYIKNSADIVCGACLANPPAQKRCYAPWSYSRPVDRWLNSLKHHANWECGYTIGHVVGAWMKLQGVVYDACLPVPLHRRRFVQRGYNQSALLSKIISAYCQTHSAERWLQRTRYTPAQQGLKAAQRRRNLRGAFSWLVEQQDSVVPRCGQHILVIDDVMTTGSTMQELGEILLLNNITFDVLVMARA